MIEAASAVALVRKILETFVVRVLGALSIFFLNVVAARHLSLGDAGIFAYFITIITVGATITVLGLDTFSIKYLPSKKAGKRGCAEEQFGGADDVSALSYLMSGAIIVLFSSLTFGGLIVLFSDLFGIKGSHEIGFLMAISLVVFSLLKFFSSSINGLGAAVFSTVLLNVIPPLLGVSLILACTYFFSEMMGFELFQYIAVVLFSGTLSLALALAFFFNCGLINFSAGFKVICKNRNTIINFFLATLMASVVQWGAFFVASFYLALDELAIYSAALRAANVVSFLLIAINLVVAPKYAYLFSIKDTKALERLVLLIGRLVFPVATAVLILSLVFSEEIISVFGDNYRSGGVLFSILIVGQFFNAICGSVGYLLNMGGHEREMRNIVFCSGIASLALAVTLISWLGVLGAALSTCLSIVLNNMLATYFVYKRLGIFTLALWKL